MRWRNALYLLFVVLLSGCGSDTITKENDFSPLTEILILSENGSAIAKGTTNQFTAIGTYSGAYTRDITTEVTWTSSEPTALMIDSVGLATGVSPTDGAALITASMNGIEDGILLQVTDATIITVAVSPQDPEVPKGLSQQFTATGTFSNATIQDISNVVSWQSTNTSVATIDQNGEAQSVQPGEATISAVFAYPPDREIGISTLTVNDAELLTIDVRPGIAEIPQRASVQYNAIGDYTDGFERVITDQVDWTSSNATVVSIDNRGVALGETAGSASITASLDSVSDSGTITVDEWSMYQIIISPEDPVIAVNEQVNMTATGLLENTETEETDERDMTVFVIWTTPSNNVASVSNVPTLEGTVTGHSEGITSVTAQSDTLTDTTSVTVE